MKVIQVFNKTIEYLNNDLLNAFSFESCFY